MDSREIAKTDRAHVRVTRQRHKGRDVVDIRVWWLPRGASEFVPSRKGVTLDASKAPALIEALQTALRDEADQTDVNVALVTSEARELLRDAELDTEAASAGIRQSSTFDDLDDELDLTPF